MTKRSAVRKPSAGARARSCESLGRAPSSTERSSDSAIPDDEDSDAMRVPRESQKPCQQDAESRMFCHETTVRAVDGPCRVTADSGLRLVLPVAGSYADFSPTRTLGLELAGRSRHHGRMKLFGDNPPEGTGDDGWTPLGYDGPEWTAWYAAIEELGGDPSVESFERVVATGNVLLVASMPPPGSHRPGPNRMISWSNSGMPKPKPCATHKHCVLDPRSPTISVESCRPAARTAMCMQ